MTTTTSVAASTGEIERRADAGTPVGYWEREIDLSDREERSWRQDGRRIVALYRDADNYSSGHKRSRSRSFQAHPTDSAGLPRFGARFNLLYSNTETLKPAIYAKEPKAEVKRRFLDDDPVARDVSEVLERALDYAIDEDSEESFDDVMNGSRDDGLLPGRGVCRIRYDAEIVRRYPDEVRGDPLLDPLTGEVIEPGQILGYALDGEPVEPDGFEDDERAYIEEKVSERVWPEHVYWEDFRFSPARRWSQVRWIAFRHILSRRKLIEFFGERGREVPLSYAAQGYESGDVVAKDTPEPKSPFKRAEVWEIWDKDNLQRVWIARGMEEVIEREDDPLNLPGFFPVPRPYVPISTTDTLIPVAEYTIYEDQATEVDRLTSRIMALVEYLKVTGLYDAVEQASIVQLQEANEGELIGIETGSELRAKGGLQGAIWFMPIDQIAQVLIGLYNERESAKQAIYEIIGISDIMRGASRASETAKAQNIKASFGSLRVKPRQKGFQAYIRSVLELMAAVMAERFDASTLQQMTGLPVSEQMIALMRDEKIRGYRIDIETDSTIQPDAEVEKQQSVELTTAMTQFLQIALQLGEAMPQIVPLLMEMMTFTFKRFGVGRSFEDLLDRTAQTITQQAMQPQGPSAEERQAQAETQLDQQKLQQDAAEDASDRDIELRKLNVQREGQLLQFMASGGSE